MPALRLLAASTLTLSVAASLLVGPPSGSAADPDPDIAATAPSTSVRTSGTQRIRVEALPQIVQQGGRVSSPDVAKAAITADIRPVEAGRKVWLQVQRGSTWQSVAWVAQDSKGRAQFAAPAAENGEPLTYRVRAGQRENLAAMTSDSVSAARWLTPIWTEEFSGSTLPSAWHHRGQTFEHSSLRRCSRGDPSAVVVRDGAVRLSVLRDRSRTTKCKARVNGKVVGEYPYRLNGHIGTQGTFSFKYGIAAARIKFQRLSGQHGAFWMQPLEGMFPGGTGHEIDVVEYFGDNHNRAGLTTFIHRYEGDQVVKTGSRITDPRSLLKKKGDRWSKSYHVFSVQWTPRTLIFRIDGKETIRISGGISSVAQYPILSLLSSDYEIPHILNRQLPQHMYVDRVRVWETGS